MQPKERFHPLIRLDGPGSLEQMFNSWFLGHYRIQSNRLSLSAVCVTVCKLLDYTRSSGSGPCV